MLVRAFNRNESRCYSWYTEALCILLRTFCYISWYHRMHCIKLCWIDDSWRRASIFYTVRLSCPRNSPGAKSLPQKTIEGYQRLQGHQARLTKQVAE
jgi:hypothetical protein